MESREYAALLREMCEDYVHQSIDVMLAKAEQFTLRVLYFEAARVHAVTQTELVYSRYTGGVANEVHHSAVRV